MIELTETNAGAIAAAFVRERKRAGSPAMGMVMTLVVVTDEETAPEAMDAARTATLEHPARVLGVVRGDRRGHGVINAQVDIGEGWSGEAAIMVPDQFLARNTAKRTKKKIITWAGACEVHETFTPADIAELRAAYPGAKIIAHPECPPEVVAAVDFAGGTAGMIDWVKTERPARVVMVTECSMSDNVAAETEGVEFVRGCNICPHMKRITLENILWSLHTMSEEVVVAPELIDPAARAVRRMLEVVPGR